MLYEVITGPDAFAADLDAIARGLEAQGAGLLAQGPLSDLRRQVSVFGFHLAPIDLRQDAGEHERVVAELLSCAGVEPDYGGLDEAARVITSYSIHYTKLYDHQREARVVLVHADFEQTRDRELLETRDHARRRHQPLRGDQRHLVARQGAERACEIDAEP